MGEPFGVSENFGHRKNLCIRKGYHYFPLKVFCPTVPKNFVGQPFNVSENLGFRKLLCIIGGFHDFPWKNFSLTMPKNFVGNPFVFQKISGMEKTMDKRGGTPLFVRNFSHSAEKIRRGTLRFLKESRVSENFMHKGGGGVITILRRKIFCLISPKNFVRETLLCWTKFRVSKKFFHERNITIFS